MDRIETLRELAKKATPGPWTVAGYPYYHFQVHGAGRDGRDSERICTTPSAVANDAPPDARKSNAAYIAAASPDYVLKLLEVVDKARAYLYQYEGVYDCVDNDGDKYQSQSAADCEAALRSSLDALEK